MEYKFCYDHERMSPRVGDDSYGQEVFYCKIGKHYLLRNGESKRHVNVVPRKEPIQSLDETLEVEDL